MAAVMGRDELQPMLDLGVVLIGFAAIMIAAVLRDEAGWAPTGHACARSGGGPLRLISPLERIMLTDMSAYHTRSCPVPTSTSSETPFRGSDGQGPRRRPCCTHHARPLGQHQE